MTAAAAPNSLFSIITGSGTDTFSFDKSVKVATGSGTYDYAPDGNISVITSSGTVTVGAASGVQPGGDDSYIVTETMKAKDPNNFIFVGKGWGHGVGLSQWGLYDLAQMHIDYEDMIQAYCPGVSFSDYKKFVNW